MRNNATALLAELKSLRRGPGVTRRKVAGCEALLATSDAQAAAQGGLDPTTAALAVLDRATAAFGDRREGSLPMSALLTAALALPLSADREVGGLSVRRQELATKYRVHVDTVRRAEERALAELAEVLLAEDTQFAGLDTSAAEQEPYEALSIDWVYRYDARGYPVEAVDRRIIRSRASPLSSFLFSVLLTGDVVISEVEVVSGGTLTQLSSPPTGYRRYQVELDEPVALGDETEIVMVRRFTVSSKPPLPFVQFIATRETTSARVRIEFSPAKKPARVLRVVSLASHLPVPFEAPVAVGIDTGTAVEYTFDNPVPGFAYGFVWEW